MTAEFHVMGSIISSRVIIRRSLWATFSRSPGVLTFDLHKDMRPRSLQFRRLYSGRIVVCLIRNFPAGPHNRSNFEVFMKAIS
jgi:hypothetical protein